MCINNNFAQSVQSFAKVKLVFISSFNIDGKLLVLISHLSPVLKMPEIFHYGKFKSQTL